MIVESKITDVTVFRDRAQVTRTANLELAKGEHAVQFDGLPDSMDVSSIQVNGSGSIVLRSIQFKAVHFTISPDERRKELLAEKEFLSDRISELDGVMQRANAEKSVVTEISTRVTSIGNDSGPAEMDTSKWEKFLEFYRTRIEKLDSQVRESFLAKREQTKKLELVNRELNSLGGTEDRTRNRVETIVECTADGPVTLKLGYMVHGPGWTPVYDIRANSKTRKVSVEYHAMLSQSTSEDWLDAHISLSTAQPQVGGDEPTLSPVYLSLYQPEVAYARSAPRMSKVTEAASEMSCEPCGAPAVPQMSYAQATVETGMTAVVFCVPGTTSVPSDNEPHRVTITINEFDAEFSFSGTPRLSPYAYLKAKVKNTSDYSLLPGESNVFLDGNFVSNATVRNVAPSEEFLVSLGVDEALKVEHQFIKRYQKEEGVISKKTRLIYEYEFVVHNRRPTNETLALHDLVPVSSNEDIAVQLLDQKGQQAKAVVPEKSATGLLEWKIAIAAGEKITIPFSFAIEYPRDKTVAGLP